MQKEPYLSLSRPDRGVIVRLPERRPCPTSLRHVRNIKSASEISRINIDVRVKSSEHSHSKMGSVRIDAFDSDAIPSSARGTQDSGIVRAHRERGTGAAHQAIAQSSGLVDVVDASVCGISSGLKGETGEEAIADEVVLEAIAFRTLEQPMKGSYMGRGS